MCTSSVAQLPVDSHFDSCYGRPDRWERILGKWSNRAIPHRTGTLLFISDVCPADALSLCDRRATTCPLFANLRPHTTDLALHGEVSHKACYGYDAIEHVGFRFAVGSCFCPDAMGRSCESCSAAGRRASCMLRDYAHLLRFVYQLLVRTSAHCLRCSIPTYVSVPS